MINNICCIIVTYNIGRSFYKCFYSVYDQVDKVVIIDNGSDKETIEVLKELEKKFDIRVIFNYQNEGIAYALNQGVRYALKKKYKWVLTMDNDSEATENMVKSMLKCYNSLNEIEKQNTVSLFPSNTEKGLIKNTDRIKSTLTNFSCKNVYTDIASGNLVKTDVFNNVGLFEDKLFIDYVDHEFCYRLVVNGYKLLKIDNAILLHSLGNTQIRKFFKKNVPVTNHSALRQYYKTRNRFYTWKQFEQLKNVQKNDKINFVKENIKIILFESDKIEKFNMILKGYKDYKRNKFGKFSG